LKLVEEGMARIQSRSLDKIINKKEYIEGQKNAQKAKKGMWINYDEAAENIAREERFKARQTTNDASSASSGSSKKPFEIAVTEIIDGCNFCYQIIGDETKALSDMMNQFQNTDWDKMDAYTPKEKEVVSAKFSQDNHWYRAEVTKVNGDSFDLYFIDYGNTETTTSKNIRKLVQDFSEKVVKRQAKEGRLAYIVPPRLSDEFGKDAAACFKELVWGKTLTATINQDRDGNPTLVVGTDRETSITINGALVAAGLARTERRRTTNAFFTALKEEEEKARRERVNIWQYGDIPDSDDEM